MSVIKVAILDDHQNVALNCADWSPILSRPDVSVDRFSDTLLSEDALVDRLSPYTIICAMRERTKFPASLLDRLPSLKLIATTGMKNAGIDITHAREKGVVVCGTGSTGDSTLEQIWALILAVARWVPQEDAGVKAGREAWQTKIPMGLWGKTLGLIGVGRLGSSTARIAKAFGMRVIGWSPNLTPERAEAAGVEFAECKEKVFRTSDIVSLHMVLSTRSRGMITKDDFALMKPTSFFINTSRGPLVDEPALIDALQRRVIAGAGLDVFDIEPLPLDHPIRKLDNVTLSPHLGYVCDSSYETFYAQTVENIVNFLDGKPSRVML